MIYVDIDGVVADFNSACVKYTGDTYRKENWEILDKISGLFYTLDVLPGARQGINRLAREIPCGYEYLGAPPLPTGTLVTAQQDKVRWIREVFQDFYAQVNLVSSRHYKKHWCRSKHDILVDDMHDNIQQWELAGGIGILHKDWNSTINQLKEIYK